MNKNIIIKNYQYTENLKSELEYYLSTISNILNFESNTWCIDKLRKSVSQSPGTYTLYFSKIPLEFCNITKYFCLIQLRDRRSISTVRTKISGLNYFFNFLLSEYALNDLSMLNNSIITSYENYLRMSNLNSSTRHTYWSAMLIFFKKLNNWKEMPKSSLIADSSNPFPKEENYDYKYISDYVINQLDIIFRNEALPVYQRLLYWLLRSTPNRISEVLGMNIDCLKPYGDNMVIFIPTWKQNGGYLTPELRSIHIKNEGHGKYIIDLIKEQQAEANRVQHKFQESEKGLLFSFQQLKICSKPFTENKKIKYYKNDNYLILNRNSAGELFKTICQRFKVKDEDGNPYVVTSHQLRHNGITDRLYMGFKPVEIRYMTGHQGDLMILSSYNHPQEKYLTTLQETILSKRDEITEKDESNNKVYFNGRILNIDEQVERMLLRNIRSLRVKGGICSDITGCRSKMFECLDCDYFVPDVNDLEYFESQVEEWEKKVNAFTNLPFLKENALYNLKLNKTIVNKIKNNLKENL